MDDVKKQLPPTAYAVMALLYYGGELSGYEIRQWALVSLRHFYWSPAQSQIYTELRRLDSAGYVEGRRVAQDGRPDKTMYSLTDDGRAALRAWAQTPVVDEPQFRHPMALRLFVGGLTDVDETRRALGVHLDQTRRRLDELEELSAGLDGDHGARFADAVARWGMQIYAADLAATESLVEELESLYTQP